MMCELASSKKHFALSIHDWYSGGFTVQKIEHQRSKRIQPFSQHSSEKYYYYFNIVRDVSKCMHANRGVQQQEHSHLKSRNQIIC